MNRNEEKRAVSGSDADDEHELKVIAKPKKLTPQSGLYASVHSEPRPKHPKPSPSDRSSHHNPDPTVNMAGLFGGGAAASSSAPATQGDISRDIPLNDPPTDGISDIAFSPISNHLSVASWDGKVRIYEINDSGASAGKALFDLGAPSMTTCWSKVGANLDMLHTQRLTVT